MFQKIAYQLFRVLIFGIGLLPFWALYWLSDAFYLVFYGLLGYRKSVVLGNLQRAFPDMPDAERRRIVRQFYRNLGDQFVEAMRGPSLGDAEVVQRYRLRNPEVLDRIFDQGRNVITVTGHFANWEWGGLAMPFQQKHLPVGLYKPLTNKYIDQFLRRTRTLKGSEARSIYRTKLAFEEAYPRPAMIGMVADQSPTNLKKAICLDFFGHPTPFLHGPELYAKLYNVPVVYVHIARMRRGYYEYWYELIENEPLACPHGDITRRYRDLLEEDIRQRPDQWLWSHKRWKRDCLPQSPSAE